MNAQVKIDRAGRVLIPKDIRECVGLQPGRVVQVKQRDGEIVLYPLSDEPKLVKKDRVLVAQVDPEEDIMNAEKRLRRARIDHIAHLSR
jgi:AbrB family looped-hinge helix DNA binding protein